MDESRALTEARRRLARAEASLDAEEGLHELVEGLSLLDGLAADPALGTHGHTARNLGRTYAIKVHEHVSRQLASRRNLPEPALRHAFAVLRAFDHTSFEVPPARELKVELVRRLIDIYYEGYSQDDKQRAYEELAKISGITPEAE